jgi:hypothetical protein
MKNLFVIISKGSSASLFFLLLMYGCEGNSPNSIIGSWVGDSSYTDTSYRYWGERHRNLQGVKEEIAKYQWSFNPDSTCYLQSSRSGSFFGRFRTSGDTDLLLSNGVDQYQTTYKIISISAKELNIQFTYTQNKAYAVGSDSPKPEKYSWTIKFKPIKSDTSANNDDPDTPTDEKVAVAQKDFERRVGKSNGAIKIDRFAKTNGYDQDFMGMKLYVLEWETTVSVQKEIWKNFNIVEGHWSDFGVLTKKPSYDPFSAAPTHFGAGATIRLTGKYTLQKKDNGWEATEYKVSTEQTISSGSSSHSSGNPQEYASKFIGTWTDGNGWLVGITYQNDQFMIRSCQEKDSTGVFYYGKYEDNKISVSGYDAERFYKYEIPSFEAKNGELLYSDGGGEAKLRRSDVSITKTKRRYDILNPVNND